MPKPVSVFCYICGREFGTKSIGIHEPQCMKKWEIQNSQLPKGQRRPRPVKPEPLKGMSGGLGGGRNQIEQYNEIAYNAAQSNLVPCNNCGRTFNPDRLPVHQRSCRPGHVLNPLPTKKTEPKPTASGDSTSYRPETATLSSSKVLDMDKIEKLNTTEPVAVSKTPKIQKPLSSSTSLKCGSCNADWEKMFKFCPFCGKAGQPKTNEALNKGAIKRSSISKSSGSKAPDPPPVRQAVIPQKPRTVVCYICGREFGSKSISIHEPQCMEKWHIQNNQLPRSQRRPVPHKPEIIQVGGGQASAQDYNESAWKAAQEALSPCPNCRRTFLPDRLQVHLRSCRA